MIVPQADDLSKIEDIPLAIADGHNTAEKLATRYNFDKRQSRYYVEAAIALGLIRRSNKTYDLTQHGQRYIALLGKQRKEFLLRLMLRMSIIQELLIELIVSSRHHLTKHKIETIITSYGKVSRSTIIRRSQTIFQWLSFIGRENTLIEEVGNEVRLNIDRSQILENRGLTRYV